MRKTSENETRNNVATRDDEELMTKMEMHESNVYGYEISVKILLYINVDLRMMQATLVLTCIQLSRQREEERERREKKREREREVVPVFVRYTDEVAGRRGVEKR